MPGEINKDNIDLILRDLGKTYRKMTGKQFKAEIVLVGGAAILSLYKFRDLSFDLDAIIRAGDAIKDAAILVGEKYGLEYN